MIDLFANRRRGEQLVRRNRAWVLEVVERGEWWLR